MTEVSRQTILIVDDAIENIEILGRALDDEYDIRFATSGEKALELIQRGPSRTKKGSHSSRRW